MAIVVVTEARVLSEAEARDRICIEFKIGTIEVKGISKEGDIRLTSSREKGSLLVYSC